MSWTLEGFELAVQDALKERFERDEFNCKAIPTRNQFNYPIFLEGPYK